MLFLTAQQVLYMCILRYFTHVHTGIVHMYTQVLYMCLFRYCTHVHTGTVHVFTHVLYTCTHRYCTEVHTGTVQRYTQVLYTCTHMCYTYVHTGTVHMYIEHHFLCTCVQLSLPPLNAPRPGTSGNPSLTCWRRLTVEEVDKSQIVAQQLCSSQPKVTRN
jgi:hypothetical protein